MLPIQTKKYWQYMLRLVAVSFLLVTMGCSSNISATHSASPEDRLLAVQSIEDVREGDLAAIRRTFAPDFAAQIASELPKLQAALPTGAPRLVDLNTQVSVSSDGPTSTNAVLTFAVDSNMAHAFIRVGILRAGQRISVTEFVVQPLPASIDTLSAFTLQDKTPVQYAFLTLAALCLLTMMVALVALLRSPGVKRRWLWGLGIIIGFGKFSIDWYSGAVSVQMAAIQLFGAGVARSGIEPWHVAFGIPIVAILFLARRKHLLASVRPSELPTNG